MRDIYPFYLAIAHAASIEQESRCTDGRIVVLRCLEPALRPLGVLKLPVVSGKGE
jgi:hypothetical protein